MKKNFKDTIPDLPNTPSKSPWDFTCPDYDQRSSCFVNAGSHHGVGYKQPVGTLKHNNKGAVPVGKGMGMTTDYVPMKNLVIELEK